MNLTEEQEKVLEKAQIKMKKVSAKKVAEEVKRYAAEKAIESRRILKTKKLQEQHKAILRAPKKKQNDGSNRSIRLSKKEKRLHLGVKKGPSGTPFSFADPTPGINFEKVIFLNRAQRRSSKQNRSIFFHKGSK